MVGGSDAQLLARIQRGDDAALEVLFERYEQPLYLFLVGILRDHHRAEDALQETFVQALEKHGGVDPDHLRGWLFTVAYHQAMLLRRKQATRKRRFPEAHAEADTVLADAAADPLARAITREDVDRCQELLERLPAGQREVIRMRVFQGMRFREIAQTLGCPLSTALARMHQGIKRLRMLGGELHESTRAARSRD